MKKEQLFNLDFSTRHLNILTIFYSNICAGSNFNIVICDYALKSMIRVARYLYVAVVCSYDFIFSCWNILAYFVHSLAIYSIGNRRNGTNLGRGGKFSASNS